MSEIQLSLLPDFIIEATEHLEEMEVLLLKLAENPADLELLNEIVRPIHTIKGAAQFVGIEKISNLSHRLEDLLDLLRDGRKESTAVIVAMLIESKDRIEKLINELELHQKEDSAIDDLLSELSKQLDDDLENKDTGVDAVADENSE